MTDKDALVKRDPGKVTQARVNKVFTLGSFVHGDEYKPINYLALMGKDVPKGKASSAVAIKKEALAEIMANAPVAKTAEEFIRVNDHVIALVESIKPPGNDLAYSILQKAVSGLSYVSPLMLELYIKSHLIRLANYVKETNLRSVETGFDDKILTKFRDRLVPPMSQFHLDEWRPDTQLPSAQVVSEKLQKAKKIEAEVAWLREDHDAAVANVKLLKERLGDSNAALERKREKVELLKEDVEKLTQDQVMFKAQIKELNNLLQTRAEQSQKDFVKGIEENNVSHRKSLASFQEMINKLNSELASERSKNQPQSDESVQSMIQPMRREGTPVQLKREEMARERVTLKEHKVMKEAKKVDEAEIRPWITFAWDTVYRESISLDDAINKARDFTKNMLVSHMYNAVLSITCATSNDVEMFAGMNRTIGAYVDQAADETLSTVSKMKDRAEKAREQKAAATTT